MFDRVGRVATLCRPFFFPHFARPSGLPRSVFVSTAWSAHYPDRRTPLDPICPTQEKNKGQRYHAQPLVLIEHGLRFPWNSLLPQPCSPAGRSPRSSAASVPQQQPAEVHLIVDNTTVIKTFARQRSRMWLLNAIAGDLPGMWVAISGRETLPPFEHRYALDHVGAHTG